MIIIPKMKIGYQDLPKIASTSLFNWIYSCLYNEKYDPYMNNTGRPIWVHGYFRKGLCPEVTISKNNVNQLINYHDYYRFALTRDPIKRFLSMYSNRVQHHRELSIESRVADDLTAAGLLLDPDINVLVSKLDEYMRCQPSIYHHARPMMDFLGPDLEVYRRIVDISETDKIIEEIKEHWLDLGIMGDVRSLTKLKRHQSGGLKLGLDSLTRTSFEKLLDYYSEDYEKISSVNLNKIKQEYSRAISVKSTDSALKVKPHGRILKEVYASTNIQKIWLDVLPGDPSNSFSFSLVGSLLLSQNSEEGIWKLKIVDVNGEHQVKWGLPSPKMAALYPEVPLASHSRFRVDEFIMSGCQPVSLILVAPSGGTLEVAKMIMRTKLA